MIVQKFTSKKTSMNSSNLPKVFSIIEKRIGWKEGHINLDLGGGKFDNVSAYFSMNNMSVTNLIYDPYNREKEHNEKILEQVSKSLADSVTISNVLNVIKEDEVKEELILLAKSKLKPGCKLFITIYEGNRSGLGKKTGTDQWQENKCRNDYTDLIRKHFKKVTIKFGMIICENQH